MKYCVLDMTPAQIQTHFLVYGTSYRYAAVQPTFLLNSKSYLDNAFCFTCWVFNHFEVHQQLIPSD